MRDRRRNERLRGMKRVERPALQLVLAKQLPVKSSQEVAGWKCAKRPSPRLWLGGQSLTETFGFRKIHGNGQMVLWRIKHRLDPKNCGGEV